MDSCFTSANGRPWRVQQACSRGRRSCMRLYATSTRTKKDGTYSSSGNQVVMRQLGAPPDNGRGLPLESISGRSPRSGGVSNGQAMAGTATLSSSVPSSGNSSTARGNGTSAGARSTVVVMDPPESKRDGIVVARTTAKTYMPAVRVAASQVAAVVAERADMALTPQQPGSPTLEAQVREIPMDVDFRWAQDSYNSTQRSVDTWVFFAAFRTRLWLLDQKWSYVGGYSDAARSVRARGLARYLLESILQLGPTFIKVGQLSSTRSDLFPPEFIEELSELQDRVPAFSASKARAIIEAELGAPVSRLFRSFEDRPIAAASLGQVHRAVLLSGEQVVVKVQRPGLRQLFDIDLGNLKLLAEALDRQDENNDFSSIYEECASVLYQEIDYILEGRSADTFRRNFRRTAQVPVRVPVVHWQYCTPRILTLEYLPGIKISDVDRLRAVGLDTEAVAVRATEAYLTQVLDHGFFHADPHPGNVAVDPASGALIFYDFGMMGTIVSDVRQRLLDVFYGVYRKDTDLVVKALVALKVIKPTGDLLSVRRAISFFILNLSRQAERNETIAAIGEDLFAIAIDQPFRFPATFTFVLRAFSTLEGIGKTLSPQYKFSDVAAPYAQRLLDLEGQLRGSGLLTQLQQQATELGTAAAAMPRRVERIDATLGLLEAGELKLRVRVLEAERAARRASVMQSNTLCAVALAGLADTGTNLLVNGMAPQGYVALGLSLVPAVALVLGLRRVQRLDKFEKEIKG